MTNDYVEKIFNPGRFELQLAKDVFWVPYNVLGDALYTIEEIKNITQCTPEEKQIKIKTLFDALQLFIISDFNIYDDAVRIIRNNVEWEYYRNGYNAVLDNGGCCSSCCAWLNYIYLEKMEKFGILAIIRPLGGHGINYFYQDGWYYFVDTEIFTKMYIGHICPQTGMRADFLKSRFLTGVMIKARTIEAFARYYRRYSFNIFPELLFIDEGGKSQSLPIGSLLGKRHILIPREKNVSVVEIGDKREVITYEYI